MSASRFPRRARRSSRVLVFARPARPADTDDPVAATNAVVDQLLDAFRRGRSLRRDYNQVHIAILQVLDELRGAAPVRWPWGRGVTAALVYQWLLAQRTFPLMGPAVEAHEKPSHRRWVQALEQAASDPRPITGNCPEYCECVVSEIASEFQFFNKAGRVDEAAFLAVVRRWVQGEPLAHRVRRWLLAQPPRACSGRRFSAWTRALCDEDVAGDLLDQMADHFGFVNRIALVAAVDSWAGAR